MNEELIHEQVRQILREGDPAAQEDGLTLDEVHAMRRTVLTAIPESRRRLGWLPLLATGVLILALAIAFGPRHRPPAAPPAAPQVVAVTPPAPIPLSPPEPAAIPLPEQKPPHRRAVRPPQSPPVRHEELMTLASLPESRPPRCGRSGFQPRAAPASSGSWPRAKLARH